VGESFFATFFAGFLALASAFFGSAFFGSAFLAAALPFFAASCGKARGVRRASDERPGGHRGGSVSGIDAMLPPAVRS
jgi:hypothetical protein